MSKAISYGYSFKEESSGVNGLTPIHQRLYCAATPDATKPDNESELDRIAIDHCLDTLAEIGVAITRRRQRLDQ